MVPIDVVDTSLPFWSVERRALVRDVNQVLLEKVAKEVVAFEKFWRPLHVLELESNVEEAAVMVTEPPAVRVLPLIVPREPVR